MNKLAELSEASIKRTMSYRYYIFLVIALAYFFVYFHRVSPSVMAPELSATFNIGASSLGLLSSMYFWPYAFAQLPSGIMSDRLGIRATISSFIVLAGIGAILFGFANNFTTALIGRALVGFGVGFVYVPAMRFLADWFKSTEFATFSGILLAIGNAGALAAAAPLVFLMGAMGWRNSMIMVGIISLVIGLLCFLVVRDKPYQIGGASPAQIEGRPETKAATTYSIGQAIRMTVGSWNVWTIVIVFFVWYGTIMAFQGLWASPWLINVYGLTKEQAGSIVSLIAVGMIVGCPLAGIIADKIFKSSFKTVLLGAGVSAVLWIPLIFAIDSMSVIMLYVLMFLYGYFNGHFVVLYANLRNNVEPAIQGTATGFLNTFVFVGGAVFQQITSVIIDRAPMVDGIIATSGFRSAFLTCFIALLVALIIFFTQKRSA